MGTLYVTEYAGMGYSQIGGSYTAVPKEPPVAEQTVAISGGSAASQPFNALTTLVRLCADSTCSRVFGSAPTATTANGRMAANQTEYHGVQAGMSVAVIANT